MESFNPHSTIGATEIGVLVSYVLFGALTIQTYTYYGLFPEDSRNIKALVAFVWIAVIAQAICGGHASYTYTVSHFDHPERIFGAIPKSLATAILFGGIASTCVQGFFSFRIYSLSEKLYVPILCWTMSFVRLLGSVAIFFTALLMTSVQSYEARWSWLLTTVWSLSVANDITITVALVVILLRRRSYAYKRTAALVDRLIFWAIETGTLTSVTTIVMLACFITMKQNFIWVAIYVVSTGLSVNSLLASLNGRATLRAMNNEIDLSFSMPETRLRSNSTQMTKTERHDVELRHGQPDEAGSEEV
ncbi:hypothetical protein B0H19DRAFT_1120370 [Mycena capillaripes]|nr:hypothetical protein B0H19DRAFT_1120370 [Mycena capillaripes]